MGKKQRGFFPVPLSLSDSGPESDFRLCVWIGVIQDASMKPYSQDLREKIICKNLNLTFQTAPLSHDSPDSIVVGAKASPSRKLGCFAPVGMMR